MEEKRWKAKRSRNRYKGVRKEEKYIALLKKLTSIEVMYRKMLEERYENILCTEEAYEYSLRA